MKNIIINIEQRMQEVLNNAQMEYLHKILIKFLETENSENKEENSNEKMLEMFLAAKKIEGCSKKSLDYYQSTITNMLIKVDKNFKHISTNDLRDYLSNYQNKSNVSKVTLDNLRRILSSFFSWLEEENFILKSPVRRIKKIKTAQTIKETYTDEVLETLRDYCHNDRDLAIIDLLASTGMRVGELVHLNKEDIDFENREYDNNALFVSLLKPHKRLKISGVEIRLRELGRKLKLPRVHPHKFRRTLATKAIDKGMPIEQVQHLLGHTKIYTTLQYAIVNQNNVKISHRRYLG